MNKLIGLALMIGAVFGVAYVYRHGLEVLQLPIPERFSEFIGDHHATRGAGSAAHTAPVHTARLLDSVPCFGKAIPPEGGWCIPDNQ